MASSANHPPEQLATPWHRDAYAIAEALFATTGGPPPSDRLLWLVDDLDHFLMTVGGRSRLVVRMALTAITRLGPLTLPTARPFFALSLDERKKALARLEHGPAGMAVFAAKTLLAFHWFEHPDNARAHGLPGSSTPTPRAKP